MPIKLFRDFLRLEAASSIILLLMALFALILSNSPMEPYYQKLLQINVKVFSFEEPLIFWINEGLMTFFFLLVGLELKREFIEGELSGKEKIILPGMAAIGGMLVPALIYLIVNYHTPLTMKGWAIPVATDIAFAIGVLSLFSRRVPLGLKLFLMALAIFDDMGAIIIIAAFYSHEISLIFLTLAGLTIAILWILNRLNVSRLFPYLIMGIILWIMVLNSGVHATISGVLLSFFIPLRKSPTQQKAPLHYLESRLHAWVAFLVMPVFAFANAGVSFAGLSWHVLLNSVTLGIALGLFLGKQSGVFAFTWVLIKLGYAKLPTRSTWMELYGVSLLCGIGFTMSLFLGTLAFQSDHSLYLVEVRVGVLLGSVISGVLGALVLMMALRMKANRRLSA